MAAASELNCGAGLTFPSAAYFADRFDRNELANRRYSQAVERFFESGPLAGPGSPYSRATEFAELSSDAVGFFAAEELFFVMTFTSSGAVDRAQDCLATWTAGELETRPWFTGPIDTSAARLAITIEAGRCSGLGGQDEVSRIDVVEKAEAVYVTAWIDPFEPLLGCGGEGVGLPAEVVLTQPLGNRTLLDAGSLPPRPPRIFRPDINE